MTVGGSSGEAELVALDVLHDHARVGAVVQQSLASRAKWDEPSALLLEGRQPLFAPKVIGDPHVEVDAVLGHLAFGHALEVQTRADPRGIDAGEPRALLLGRHRVLEVVPRFEVLERRHEVPQHLAPEPTDALGFDAVEGDLDLLDRRPRPTPYGRLLAPDWVAMHSMALAGVGRLKCTLMPRCARSCRWAGPEPRAMTRAHATNRWGHRGSSGTMTVVDQVEVVVAHQDCATLRVGDVFLKIDADQTRTDVEVEAMRMAPIPTPEVLWRKPPVLAIAALPGRALGRLGRPSTASPAAWAAVGAAVRMLHDAPLPPWPGRSLDEIASRLDSECEWLVANDVLPADLVTRNRRLAEAALRPWTPVFTHGDLQIDPRVRRR